MTESTDAAATENTPQGDMHGITANDITVNDAAEAEVALLLGSWHSAAERLEASHRAKCDEACALRAQVRRLREELAVKNAELAQRHRLSDFGATVARVAREMQERVQSVRHHLDLLQRRLVNDDSGRNLASKLTTDLTAWEAGLHDLIGFAFEGQPETDLLSVRDLVDGARSALTHQLTQRAVHIVVDVPEETRTTGDQQLLQRAIINVVLQALDRVPHGGEVVVAATEGKEATEVEVAYGSPPTNDKPSPSGSRTDAKPHADQAAAVLRWAVVHHILQQHGGEALTKGDDHGGTSYVLRIPHEPRS
jgi:signal transduction histidine kinase